MYVLSVGLLVIGVTAVIKYPVSGVGTPYYGGCFIVGCLALIYALVCSYIAFKGADDTNNGTSKKEVVHAITCQFILSVCLFIGCLIGTIFAGFGGLRGKNEFDKETGYEDIVRALSGVTIAGCILTAGVNLFGMCTICNNGSHLGNNIKNQGAADVTFGTAATGYSTQTGGIEMGVIGTECGIITLHEQNRLLQEQVRLQQELLNQKQLGVHSPPPPNYPVGGVYDKSEHPFPSAPPSPSCPPPSYDSLK
ncbi:uncharacterized protein LOC128234161 isoform X2 [Mya arenaria]|nr:uncharacterized protein LOC128234161 isoform X2 [Mya arenaria]XP_052804159.1 uncharacterized protein LOC128234161 isoform X2 [Mya arenaria]